MTPDFKWMDEAGEQYHRERNMESVEKFIEEWDKLNPKGAVSRDIARLVRLVKRYREALQTISKSPRLDCDWEEIKDTVSVEGMQALRALQYTGLSTPENVDEGNGG